MLIAGLLALSPLGFLVAGIFTLAGSVPLHMVGFLLVAGTPVVTFVLAGRFLQQVPGWTQFGSRLVAASPLTAALVVAFFLCFDRDTMGISGDRD